MSGSLSKGRITSGLTDYVIYRICASSFSVLKVFNSSVNNLMCWSGMSDPILADVDLAVASFSNFHHLGIST